MIVNAESAHSAGILSNHFFSSLDSSFWCIHIAESLQEKIQMSNSSGKTLSDLMEETFV